MGSFIQKSTGDSLEMDLSSPGSPRTAQGKGLAASLAAANGFSDSAASSINLDKTFDGNQTGEHDTTNPVRLRLECITEGQMKVRICSHEHDGWFSAHQEHDGSTIQVLMLVCAGCTRLFSGGQRHLVGSATCRIY